MAKKVIDKEEIVIETIVDESSTSLDDSTMESNININYDIKFIQKALNVLKIKDEFGKKLIENGELDTKTISAIERLQKILGFETDGKLSQNIVDAINYLLIRPVIQCNTNNNIAKKYIQYRVGSNEDSWGPHTDILVKQWQKFNGLIPNGIIDRNSWIILIDLN